MNAGVPAGARDSHVTLQFRVDEQTMSNPNGRVAAMYRQANDMNGLNRSNSMVALSLTQGAGVELSMRPPGGENDTALSSRLSITRSSRSGRASVKAWPIALDSATGATIVTSPSGRSAAASA